MTKRLIASEKRVGEWVEGVSAAAHQLGVANGLRQAADEVRERAGSLFMEKRDEEAKTLRAVGEALRRMAGEAQQVYTNQYQTAHAEALEEIGKLDAMWEAEERKQPAATVTPVGGVLTYKGEDGSKFEVSYT